MKLNLSEIVFILDRSGSMYGLVNDTIREDNSFLDSQRKVEIHFSSEDERASKVIFVITTNGYENASQEFTYNKVNEMISHLQNKNNWECLFLGANIEVVKEVENLGVKASRAAKYLADSLGTEVLYSSLAENLIWICF